MFNNTQFNIQPFNRSIDVLVSTSYENESVVGQITLSYINYVQATSLINLNDFGQPTSKAYYTLESGSLVNVSEVGEHLVKAYNDIKPSGFENQSEIGLLLLTYDQYLIATSLVNVNEFGDLDTIGGWRVAKKETTIWNTLLHTITTWR